MKYPKKVLLATVCCVVFFGYLALDKRGYVSIVDQTLLGSNPTDFSVVEPMHSSVHLSALSTSELSAYKFCESQVQSMTSINPAHIKPSCSFMNGTGRNVVALVSETGSGNTWVRGLLEKATGICTGAIYCDPALRNTGMLGEFVVGPSVLVVKTHTPDYQWEGVPHLDRESDPNHKDGYYGSAILLLRNPFDAFVSEWNRYVAIQKLESLVRRNASAVGHHEDSHTHLLGKDMFGK